MANDRLYLRCQTCRAELLLAKWWGSSYSVAAAGLGERLDAFLNEHWLCGAGDGLRTEREKFEFVAESGR